jgi:hypothetical protein
MAFDTRFAANRSLHGSAGNVSGAPFNATELSLFIGHWILAA